MRKLVALLVALLLTTALAPLASAETATLPSGLTINLTGMPIVDEKVDVTIMAYVPTGAASYEELLFTKEMEARSNVHVNWIEVSPLAVVEKVNLALASGDLPDAFFKCSVTANMQNKYGGDGVFVPLNGYLETYMPGFHQALNAYKDLGPSISMPDGTIYSVPYTNGIPSMGAGPNGWYNQKFYDALGLTEPKTLDEFYDVLVAVRDGDPNGNGIADEIPFQAGSFDEIAFYIGAAYGLRNRGSSCGLIDEDPDNPGTVRFWSGVDRYREALDYARKLWVDGLLDQEMASEIAARVAKYNANIVGFTIQLYTQLDAAGVDFAHITQPLEGPYGDLLSYASATSFGTGNFLITTQAKHPEVLCRWVDYFYTDAGMELYFMGVENETFLVKEDGTLTYTEDILRNPDGLTYVQAFGRYLCWGDGRNPALLDVKYFQGGAEMTPQQLSLSAALAPYKPEVVWPALGTTEEEAKFFATNGVDIETLVKEFRASWIAAKIDNTDEVWNNYMTQLTNMGLDKYIEHKQAAYDRYKINLE